MRTFFQSAAFAAALLLSSLIIAPAGSFAADAARIELNKATAAKIVELRESLGGFQSFDDLGELSLPADQMQKLQDKTSVQGISSDCNC